ncbi:sugar porter family MFS transporter [candidate division KSB1 bacterium]|nr:sugar porter family MFS transporter [candidate division KSB1 bacterium]
MSRTQSAFLFRTTIVAALGGLLFGYDTAVIAGAIGFFRTCFGLNAAQMGWAASSALVGCVIGCAMAGIISDRFGRKKVLILAALMFLVSALGSALAGHVTEFVIYRIIGGVGVGTASMLSPLYIAEISPARLRGRLVSVNQLTIVSGMLIVYFVNYFIALQGAESWNITTGWRWMFGSEALPALLFLIFIFFVPESPRWLMKQGEVENAKKVLFKVSESSRIQDDLDHIKETILQETCRFSDLFRSGLRPALFLGIALAVLQQVTGINVFLYYAPEIFKKLGSGSNIALLQTIIVGAVNLSFTLVAIKTVDKLGRKPLMLIGSAGMGFCLFALGLIAYFDQTAVWVLFLILGYIACFALSVGPVTWVILSEIFPTRIRGRALSVATVFLWAANWLVSQTFPMLDENEWLVQRFNHGFTFWLYGVMCLVLILVILKWTPETKGKTLEEIEALWNC